MREKDINILLKKAEEMRALFVLGQSIIPFMEEIFLFVREIQPLLSEINNSIEDNLQKMPKATTHLSKVTEATEIATTEIMDTVDGVISKANILEDNIMRMRELYEQLRPEVADGIMADENLDIVIHSRELLSSLRSDSSSIMMALQVQDITSQQIAAVNHLLEAIQIKLTIILKRFTPDNIDDMIRESEAREAQNVTMLHRAIAFDPDAVNTLSPTLDSRQSEVDMLIRSHAGQEAVAAGIARQASFSVQEESIPVPPPSTRGTVEISQNDIDALFKDLGLET